MDSTIDLEQALEIPNLRAQFLRHTRHAYELLPVQSKERILDIGCGQGMQTLELARLSKAQITGIDSDKSALKKFQSRLQEANLTDRITILNRSFYDNGFPDNHFDLLWEEGVLHLLKSDKSFLECRRLMKPGGYLVLHEKNTWFESIREKLSGYDLEFVKQYLLPKHCWWTDYGKPLEERIRAFKQMMGNSPLPKELTQFEKQVADLKAAPGKYDCGFFFVRKRG